MHWTDLIFTDIDYTWRQDSDLGSEYVVSITYGYDWHWAGGFRLTDNNVGLGFQYQF